MKSAKSVRRTVNGLLLVAASCVVYFLSTGPAMNWLYRTENETVEASLRGYLTPLKMIDRRLNNYSEFMEIQNQRDRRSHESFIFPEPSMTHKTIVWYITLWNEDAGISYQFLYYAD